MSYHVIHDAIQNRTMYKRKLGNLKRKIFSVFFADLMAYINMIIKFKCHNVSVFFSNFSKPTGIKFQLF